MKTMKRTQRIRVIIGEVYIITSMKDIIDHRLRMAIEEIEAIWANGEPCVGLCKDFDGVAMQVTLID